jgi:formylglycine-generating enzyme required for sulfatase activity
MPDYLAPEQAINSHKVDVRADVYSLGCSLYHLLAGRTPFADVHPAARPAMHLSQEPPPIEGHQPDLPAGVAEVVRKMMAKDRDRRFQTPGEAARALAALRGLLAPLPRTADLDGPAAPPRPAAETPSTRTVAPRAAPSALAGLIAGAMLTLLACGTAWIASGSLRGGKGDEQPVAREAGERDPAEAKFASEVAQARAERDDLERQLEEAKRQARALELARAKAESQARGLEKAQTKLTGDAAKVKAERDDLERQLEEARLRGRALKLEREKVEGQAKGLQQKLDKAIGQLAAVTKQQEESEQKAKDLGRKLQAADVRAEALQKKLDAIAKAASIGPLDKEGKNGIGMKFAKIPKGTFMMGANKDDKDANESEKPRHEVEITRDFYLGVYEVTQKQYKQVMGTNPSSFCKEGGGKDKVEGMDTDDFPVENVSWNDAQEFLKKLNEREKKALNGWKYRLPTEAEWERACRAGVDDQKYHFGDTLSPKQANFDDSKLNRTEKVGSYPANKYGLHDMHGNVYEWCEDWYDERYYQQKVRVDPPGPKDPTNLKVQRGGAWIYSANICSTCFRNNPSPDSRESYYGFRAALVPAR